MPNCSLRKRMLYVLLALMLLPVVSAFAWNNTFPVNVTGPDGVAVPGATVLVWDQRNTYYNNTYNPGITDSNGHVEVVLAGLEPTADNLSNPSPNVGFLVLPDNTTFGTSLAFAVAETRFFNFFGTDARHTEPINVTLNKGCLITVAPEKVDPSTDPQTTVHGLANYMWIAIPGVPTEVKSFTVYNTGDELTAGLSADKTWQIVWPFSSELGIQLSGDSGDVTKPEYYDYDFSTFQIPDAATVAMTVKPQHIMKKKGKFTLTTDSNDTQFKLFWNDRYSNDFYEYKSGNFTGVAEIFLPYGIYNFKFQPADTTTVNPPIEVFPSVEISQTPVEKTVTAAGGSALSGRITLANGGNLAALRALEIVCEKLVNIGGYDQWLEIETISANNTYDYSTGYTYDGTYNFKYRLMTGEGEQYRIITRNRYDSSYAGIIDYISSPKRCYSDYEGAAFSIVTGTAAHVYDFTLNQAAAVIVNVSVLNAPANGNYCDMQVAVLPSLEYNYGYRINSKWNSSNNELFVPFVDSERQILARVDYDEDYNSTENPVCMKVSAPIQPEAGKTVVVDLEIDPSKFQVVSASLSNGSTAPIIPGTPTPPTPPTAPTTVFPFTAYAHVSPLLVLNGKTWMVAELMGNYIENSYGFEFKVFSPADPQPLEFKAELGKTYRILVSEQIPSGQTVKPLQGILPFGTEFTVETVDPATPKTIAMVVDEGRSFFGKILENSVAITDMPTIGVRLTSIVDATTGYVEAITRQQAVKLSPDGTFRVSGIPAGRYAVNLILDSINPSSPVYNVQEMPLINREIYVDETATTNSMTPTTIQFNFDDKAIGWLSGLVTDEKGAPIEGAKVEICKSAAEASANYYNKDSILFFCTTNAAGQMVTPSSGMIPLESGNYSIYVVGIATPPADFNYQFSEPWQKPLATVQVFANSQVTNTRVTLQRKFQVAGSVKEGDNLINFANIQIMDMNGNQVNYAMTDEKGEFAVYNGLVAGDYLFGIFVDGGRKFYQYPVRVVADQPNNFAVVLDPNSLKSVRLKTEDSNGQPLAEANGSIILFADRELLFRGDYTYVTWAQSDLEGYIDLALPIPAGAQASWVYAFQGHPKYLEANNVSKTYVAPDITILNLESTTPQVLVWKAPINVTVEATGVPSGAEGKYVGVLMAKDKFLAGPVQISSDDKNPDQMTEPGHGDRSAFYAAYADGKFLFENVVPNREYVFLAYEAFDFVSPETLRWAYFFPAPALFRYLSAPFMTAAVDVTQKFAFWPLADLTVTCTQDSTLPTSSAVRAFFTPNSVSTSGNVGWPVLAGDATMNLTYPVKLPASYSYRIAFAPAASTGMVGKVWEDVMLTSAGRTLDMVVTTMPKLSGFCTIDTAKMPINGSVVLIPQGVDATAANFQPIRFPIINGNYSGYLKPGFYHGYVVPMAGYSKYIQVEMGTVNQTMNVDLLANGHPIRGTVVMAGETAVPIVGAAIRVMRKQAAVSSLTDGQPLYPYPGMMGKYEIPCGPMGEFFFPAEVGVDYYVQAVVPAGFKPGAPVRVAGADSKPQVEQVVNIVVGSGASISGYVNAPCHIEARPVGGEGLSDGFGSSGSFYADSYYPDPNNPASYPFTIVGLDETMAYDISFWPADGAHSYMQLTNIVPPASNLKVTLSEGFKITGQLVDTAGKPLNAASVSVNLAMTMAMVNYNVPATGGVAASVRPRQSVRAEDVTTTPGDYDLENTMMNGMWTMTDQYGRFTFNNVPEFLTAFIKTENGFTADGVSYGRARTDDFYPAFATTPSMHFNVKVPVGGRIIGRLIDDAAKPIAYGGIDAILDQEWAWGQVKEDGSFVIDGLAPGSNYMVHVMDMPGYASVFRTGVLVEPGKTTDLGTLVAARAVYAFGMASGTQALAKRSFPYGVSEEEGVVIAAVDASRALTDEDLLSGKFQQAIQGDADLCLDSSIDELGFNMQLKAGKTHIAAFLYRESDYGFDTLVSWGWKTGMVVPTQEQLGSGAFEITTSDKPLMFPQKFGDISGTLIHKTDAAMVFGPTDAVIVLLPAVASGTGFVPGQAPFPVALTRAINGKWLIKDVPQGKYYAKAITSKYGASPATLVTIGDTAVVHPIEYGNAVKKITGQVVLADGTTPVTSAKVNLVLKNMSTSTDASGNFSFFLPVNEFFIPQIEIAKPGIKTMRITEVKSGETVIVASAGAYLTDPTKELALGKFLVSTDVGSVEITVTSSKDKKPYIGAEVAMVFQEDPTKPVWTVGELQTTNEAGIARFLSVPIGKAITFRARAHYHAPALQTLEAAKNTGVSTLAIEMPVLLPKVFYTGTLTPIDTDPNKLTLKASFDFNQVVVKDAVGLYIGVPGSDEAAADRVPSMPASWFPDLIGTRITNMLFNGEVSNAGGLVASVTFTDAGTVSQIGSFSLLQTAMFRKEFEVDPLAADGFTGRQVDNSGNTLPTGISVPPGYLPPTVSSFELEVASPTEEMTSAGLDGAETGVKPEFAGPTFKFSFQGDSNLSASTKQEGLFTITMAYTAGTNLEPRWYDTTNKVWSKVGIIPGSIEPDKPQPGYITFKVDHLTEFAVLKNVADSSIGMRCDYDRNGKIGDEDLMFLVAAIQTKLLAQKYPAAYEYNLANVKSKAGGLYPNYDFSKAALPDNILDDLNEDGNSLGDADLIGLVAYIQTKLLAKFGIVCDSKTVTEKTSILMPSFVGVISRLPGDSVNR